MANGVIGIMGGTFNPIHLGHLELIKAAHKQFDLNKILVMPSGTPVYKDQSLIVSATHRCNMVELAIKDYNYMELSTIEIDRKGNTYTADTLRQIGNDYDKIYFIIGADSLFAITDWYKPQYICANCHLLCANRGEYEIEELNRQKNLLVSKYNAKIDFIKCESIPISSTEIRNKLKKHESIDDMVGRDVEQYILDNNLYI